MFEKSEVGSRIDIEQNDEVLKSTASAVQEKLQQDASLICNALSGLVRLVDPRFCSNILNGAEIE